MTYQTPTFFNVKINKTLVALSVTGVCAACLANPTFAAAPAINSFKDSNFKDCVLSTYNRDHGTDLKKLTVVQLKTITSLDCSNRGIKNASGTERLTGLTSLNLSGNQLSSINLTLNTKLTWLNLSNNQLRALNITKQTKLTDLYISNNQISNLDVRKNKRLSTVYADNILFTTNATACQSGSNYILDLKDVPFFHASSRLYTGGLYDYVDDVRLMATKDRAGLENMMQNNAGFEYVPGYTYRIKLPAASNVTMSTIARRLANLYRNHATTYAQLVVYLGKYGVTEQQTRSAALSLGINYGRQAMLSDISNLLGYFMAKSHGA